MASTLSLLLRLFVTLALLIAVESSSRFLGSTVPSPSTSPAPSPLPLASRFRQVQNIPRGSYISTSPNEANFWLSDSRSIAFGFYPICHDSGDDCSRYVVGIWLVNTQQDKSTLAWSLNNNSPPVLIGPSSIRFTNDGQFLLQTPNGEEQYLFDTLSKPASYAELLDNGNFVTYNSESVILWNSFDHPTDTILSGQTLKPGQTLNSSTISTTDKAGDKIYKLAIQDDGKIVLSSAFAAENPLYTPYWEKAPWAENRFNTPYWDENGFNTPYWEKAPREQPKNSVTLQLDSMGGLYLVSHDNEIVREVSHKKNNKEDGVLYRVTLGTDGYLRLFMERRIRSQGGGGWKTTQLWDSFQEDRMYKREYLRWTLIIVLCPIAVILAIILLWLGLARCCK